ncbi:MAG: hypothetical protein DWG76_05195 [Chloroflexi bacterium]|nr:hypothetical protein [Chloroflexota bacterium]MQC26829.1 hypothetical protein [Chloroflexota bacterium]
MSKAQYNREIYSRTFARLLNKALKRGNGDAQLALAWLDRRHHLLFALLFTRYKLETTDAYLDVREHIENRIAPQINQPPPA